TNKQYFGWLVDLLGQDARVRDCYKVFLNPTLRRQPDGTLVFLLMNGVRETFQRLPSNPAIELIERILESRGEPHTVLELVDELRRRPELDVSADQIRSYIEKLMLIGLLRLTTGIPAQELDWNRALRHLLGDLDHTPAVRALELLRQLERQTASFARASSKERAQLLQEVADGLTLFCKETDATSDIRNPIYEDATSSSGEATIRRTAGCQSLEHELARYVELTSRLSPLRGEMATMRHFFETHYGDDSSRVPLLTFYEDYYREHFKAHLKREAQGHKPGQVLEDGYDMSNPFGLGIVSRMLKAHGRLVRFLGQRFHESSKDLAIEFSDLEEIMRDVPPCVRSCESSVMFFGELGARPEPGH
ncbi:MAG: hypothetical protein AAFX50_24965, partial [Acidobacteriota bacterium]